MQLEKELRALIAMAEGTLPETRVRVAESHTPRLAQLVLDEVAGRTVLFDPPSTPVTVQFELISGGTLLEYHLTVGVGVSRPTPAPGRAADPAVVIRQDLAELLRAVYGTAAARHDATRAVAIRNEPGPETDDPDDPWLAALRAATLAAGQVFSAASPCVADLGSLARRFGSDKWGDHFYTANYERHLSEYRDQRITLLEIGVGGFESPALGGESLRMWKHYFRRGLIYGLDVFPKTQIDEPRVRTVQGDQADPAFLRALAAEAGPFDIIIDDGSHLSADIITSFTTLFPLLNDGGLYVIEDLQTSYWPGWNGNRSDSNDPRTAIGFLKTLVDGLHHQDRMPGTPAGPFPNEQEVRAMHWYHNLVFLEKGVNAEPTAPSWVRRHESDMDLVPKGSMRRQ